MKDEIWKDIKGYEGYYQVSTLGNVRSCTRTITRKSKLGNTYNAVLKGKILPISLDGSGYPKVNLNKDSKHKNKHIHRLVAETFIDNSNPTTLTEVNHIDENKLNNSVDNLEWCDRKYNNHHSLITETLNEAKKKSVLQFSKSGELLREFSGVREAARELGLKTHKHISECCNGKAKTAGGYYWKWKDS